MNFRKKRTPSQSHSTDTAPPHKPANGESLFKGIMLAHLILAIHVVLMAGVGLVVLFFRGVTSYMLWIFLSFLLIVLFLGYYLYRRARREGQNLKDALRSPAFNGRAVEVSVLGGLASFRMGRDHAVHQLEDFSVHTIPQLEDPARVRLREIKDLARLLENNMITQEEYNQMKQQLFDSHTLA